MPRPDYSDWLTKQAAAEALNVSTKTIETWAKEGKLQQATWRRPAGGAHIVVYHPGDVEALRLERHQEPSAFVVPAGAERVAGNGHGASALAAIPPVDDVAAGLRALLAAVVSLASQSSQKSLPAPAPRLFLTFDEAAEFTGLPRAYLRRLVRQGKLAATSSRPRMLRRVDLENLEAL